MKRYVSRHTFAQWLKGTLVFLTSAVIVLWAWNAVMPDIFGLATMEYRHALGLLILGAGLSFILRPSGRLYEQGSRKPHGCPRADEAKP